MKFSLLPYLQHLYSQMLSLRKAEDMGSEQGMSTKEKLSIFFICYLFAVAMWSLVNLGREFEITLKVPVQLSNIPSNYVLREDPVKQATVTVNGEGWMLMSIYNGTPKLNVPLNPEETSKRVILSELMKRELNSYPNVNLVSVEPSVLQIDMEKRIQKKVPVKASVTLNFKAQHNYVTKPRISPDSVRLSGSKDALSAISYIETETIDIKEVKESVDLTLALISPSPKIQMDRLSVRYRAKVAEFTEGEIRVFVKTVNLPEDAQVRYSPAVISIRYDVPIDEYAASQEIVPYSAYVDYREIANDSTGFVTPIIQNDAAALHLRLRSYQPKRVSYYNVLSKE